MPVDGLTHLLVLNKHSINFNYCCCIKQFSTCRSLKQANDGRMCVSNMLIEYIII